MFERTRFYDHVMALAEDTNLNEHLGKNPYEIASQLMRYIDQGMPELDVLDPNDPYKGHSHSGSVPCEWHCPANPAFAESARTVQEDSVPSLNVGSEVRVNDVAFIVTDFQNSYDRPARAALMSIAEIQKSSQQVSRRHLPFFGQVRRPYSNPEMYGDE